jgi:transposase InsO family protein
MKLSYPNVPVHDTGVKAIMNVDDLERIEDLENFLSGTQAVMFAVEQELEKSYAWVQKTLIKFKYPLLRKYDKGVVKRFVLKVTGYSRQQFDRFAKQYLKTGRVRVGNKVTRTSFKRIFTPMDIHLLAELDELHGTLNGAATKKLLARAYLVFQEAKYERLSKISMAHIYNLRKSKAYKMKRWLYDNTKSKPSSIGERRKPRPNGKPGYIRIDTVHQGDLDGEKGVYHINAVDEVTQFEVVCAVEKISEQYLIPVLEQLLNTFPFVIIGFHSDNGSEYVNKNVVQLLDKLHIEFTKSRPRHSNDNALAEGKNGAIIRKILGYMHIPQPWAEKVNEFHKTHLNPYINYHRPCLFVEVETDDKGKQRKKYPHKGVMTPYEKLKSLPDAKQYLREGLTFDMLDAIERQMSDLVAAKQMQDAKDKLFQAIHKQKEACY